MGWKLLHIQKDIVETADGKLQYSISGSGTTKVVLINGGSGPIEGWMKILPEVSKLASVFSYNRFGVGGSDKPKKAQDGTAIVENLREALKIVGFAPPYLLVGHSLGGLYANLFAQLYPTEVAGVVFLESSHPNDISLDKYQGKVVKTLNKMLSIFDYFSTKKHFNEVNFVKQTVSQIQQVNFFPDIPVYVITGGKENRMMPKKARQIRSENQRELLSLSAKSKQIIAENSGHFPQLSEPKVVISAIKDAVRQMQITNEFL